ncbi:MAG: twin-arginine translocation signal domain-containing protein [Daejeonella sp.]
MSEKETNSALTDNSRRNFIKSSAIGIGSLVVGAYLPLNAISHGFSKNMTAFDEPIKAFNIDYNWGPGGAHGFAKPGLWADANPKTLMKWYEDLGCNVVHSFGVSCNGYAWYKNPV